MGTDNLHNFKKKGRLTREIKKIKEYKNSILIICEGEKTEPNYFKSFPASTVKVETIGTGRNTLSLVEDAIKIWKKFADDGSFYERLWCVFDKDDFPAKNYNQAFETVGNAQKNLNKSYGKKTGRKILINIAYSNNAFELWYLLHYIYFDTEISRSDYITKLKSLLGKEYKKNDPEIYKILNILGTTSNWNQGQLFAIHNAKKQRKNMPQEQWQNQNPSTTVDLLVEELNQHLKK